MVRNSKKKKKKTHFRAQGDVSSHLFIPKPRNFCLQFTLSLNISQYQYKKNDREKVKIRSVKNYSQIPVVVT